jgi:hypothetical protein
MHLRASHKSSRLPKRFPVGATYVVEGRAGARGQLLVSSRYVVLPGGRRIDVSADFGKFTPLLSHGRSRLSTPSGRRPAPVKASQSNRSKEHRFDRSSVGK